jgi:uncharacterized protein (TIGR03083 family)
VIVEREIDSAALYEQTRLALLDLVESLSDEQRRATVPASPAWSVQDVIAHVTGIAADLNTGHLPEVDPEVWTAEQVESRRGRTLHDLRTEWDAEAPAFEDGLRLFGYGVGSHFLGDLLQHLCDVRHAVGLPRIPDDDTLLVALDFYVDSFHETLLEAGVGSVVLTVDDQHWTLGTGDVVATWTTDRYECLRALGGRRDEAQIRRAHWTGDVDRIVGMVSRYGPPTEGIVEP